MEFMCRKMYAYVGYLYCLAEWWSIPGLVLSQIQISWNMGYLEGMKEWSWWLPILFELHNLQLGMESGLLFFFFCFLEDNSTLLCWFTLNFFEVLNGKLLWDELRCLRWWLRGSIAGKSGFQYPEWVTDRLAMFGLANGGFLWDEGL